MNILWTFIIFNAINVVIQTVKSIATIKCGKTAAAFVNAVAYGLYTYVVILTVCDLPLLWKCLIVAGCNFIGVWVVKWVEEKARKDKLWKVEATIPAEHTQDLHCTLTAEEIPNNYIVGVGKYSVFNCYCATQKDSAKVKEILNQFNAKYFVSESKTL